MDNGCVQFSVMAVSREEDSEGKVVMDESVAFTAEMMLHQSGQPDVWLEDGEHTLKGSVAGCALVVRSLVLAPFGFKNAQHRVYPAGTGGRSAAGQDVALAVCISG